MAMFTKKEKNYDVKAKGSKYNLKMEHKKEHDVKLKATSIHMKRMRA